MVQAKPDIVTNNNFVGKHLALIRLCYSRTLIISTPLGSKKWYLVSKVLLIHVDSGTLIMSTALKWVLTKQGTYYQSSTVIMSGLLSHSKNSIPVWFWQAEELHALSYTLLV